MAHALDRPLEYLSLDFDQRTTPAHLEAFKRGLAERRGLRSLRLEGARAVGGQGTGGVGVPPVQGLESLQLVRCDVKRGDLLQYLNLDVNELSRKAQAALRKHFANAEVQAR